MGSEPLKGNAVIFSIFSLSSVSASTTISKVKPPVLSSSPSSVAKVNVDHKVVLVIVLYLESSRPPPKLNNNIYHMNVIIRAKASPKGIKGCTAIGLSIIISPTKMGLIV